MIVRAALVAGCFAARQSVQAQATPDPVARHRAAYQVIERNLDRYRHARADMDSLGLERQSADGGRLDAYCEGDRIRLLVGKYFGETGDATYSFYFAHDSLFFALVETRRGRPNGK